jgi:transcriptional regulator with XRE-family HTH domain
MCWAMHRTTGFAPPTGGTPGLIGTVAPTEPGSITVGDKSTTTSRTTGKRRINHLILMPMNSSHPSIFFVVLQDVLSNARESTLAILAREVSHMPALINGQTLRAVREAKGWNQQALARHAGVDNSVISRLEREMQEDLKVSVLLALATALEVPVTDLLTFAQPQPGALVPQLSALMAQVAALPDVPQRTIAAIIQGYLVFLAESE